MNFQIVDPGADKSDNTAPVAATVTTATTAATATIPTPGTWDILNMDALEGLSLLPDKSANCCVTSPPYYGLRDYGTAKWEGGSPDCDHKLSPTMQNGRNESRPMLAGSVATNAYQLILAANSVCGACGATKVDNQIGLERTPEEYIGKLVAVFREVRRVLRDDGVLWVNIGDSYCSGSRNSYDQVSDNKGKCGTTNLRPQQPAGLKPKDLIGIPWMLAFALRADGWYLRQDIIWHKPNPMPESVKDRCTKAHEYVFMLTKSERYYYNAAAIAEDAIRAGCKPGGNKKVDLSRKDSARDMNIPVAETRNRRSVWTITPKPYREAHFATFPPELPNLCISATCPTGGTVIDPFCGSGTTGAVAVHRGCNFLGIELIPEYIAMAERRIREFKGL